MSSSIILNNLLVQYYPWKETGTSTVLFLHGWRSEGKVWQPVIEKLLQSEKDISIYSLDLPGFGASQIPERDYTLRDYMQIVKAFVQKLQLDNVILIGHSFGGRIGIKLAATQPSWLKKLVLVDSAGFTPLLAKKRTRNFIAKIVKPLFKPRFMQGLRRKIYAKMGAEDYLATPALRGTFVHVINEDLSACLPKIQVPTLLVWGDQDKDTPLDFAKRMKENIADSKLEVLADAGHYSFLDQPDEFVEILKIFIPSS